MFLGLESLASHLLTADTFLPAAPYVSKGALVMGSYLEFCFPVLCPFPFGMVHLSF